MTPTVAAWRPSPAREYWRGTTRRRPRIPSPPDQAQRFRRSDGPSPPRGSAGLRPARSARGGAARGGTTPAPHVIYPTVVHAFYIMGDVSPAVVEAAREAGAAIRTAL